MYINLYSLESNQGGVWYCEGTLILDNVKLMVDKEPENKVWKKYEILYLKS